MLPHSPRKLSMSIQNKLCSFLLLLCLSHLQSSTAFWIPEHKDHEGPPLRPASSACKAIVQKLGTYIPNEWRCHCKSTNDTVHGYYIGDEVLLLPHLNEDYCTVQERATVCDPDVFVGPGKGPYCKFGSLDVALSMEPKSPSPWGENQFDDEIAATIIEVWRNWTCKYTPEHASCTDKAAKLPGVVLDYGAEQTGRQLRLLSDLFPMSTVFGYNVRDEKRTLDNDFAYPGPFTLVLGDAQQCLPFPDNSFDFLYSVNVMEHANPVEKYLAEALRVLKPGGLLYLDWQPLWFSARGHHVHDDMVRELKKEIAQRTGDEWCLKAEYSNDGKTIPDWSHLWQTKEEWRNTLYKTTLANCGELVEFLVESVYEGNGLNRASLAQVLQFLEATQVAELVQTKFHTHSEGMYDLIAEQMAAKYGTSDFLIKGAKLWIRRKPGSVGPVNLAEQRMGVTDQRRRAAARRKAIDDTHQLSG